MTDDLDLERRRLALACADVGVFELDLEAGTITLDRRAAELVGVGAEGQVSFETYLASVDPVDRDRVAHGLTTVTASHGDPYQDEFRTLSQRWIAADGRATHDRTQRRLVLVGLLRDVTLRRTTEDARALSQEQMNNGRFELIRWPAAGRLTGASGREPTSSRRSGSCIDGSGPRRRTRGSRR